jgi:TP901 family phage tail tape measure protein
LVDYNLGTARGTIEITASSLARAISGLDAMGNKMLAIGAIAVAGLGYAVKQAADFQQELSRFGAVGNATEKQMEAIRSKALQLGRDSAYGATEVAKAFTELAYAGASTKEIIEGLGDATVYLAAAGEIPLADASRTLINTMRQFNIPAKEAVGIADELARAANASTVDIDDLNTSLRYAGPVAAAMGFEFRDVAQALAILGNEGIRGSTAGTSLRGVMLGLTAISGPAKEALHTLGLDTNEVGNNFFTAEGKMRSFKEISEILRGAMGHLGQEVFKANGELKSNKEISALLNDSTVSLTDKTKLQAFAQLFQRRAMASAFALAKDGSGAFDKLSNSQQYNTTASEIMKKKLDNLKGSLKILKASLETLAISIGTYLLPPLQELADALREAVNWFEKLPDPIKQAFVWALLAFGGFMLLGGILFKLGSWTLRAYRAFKDLGVALGLLRDMGSASGLTATVTAFGAVVFVILILIAAVILVKKYWDEIFGWIAKHKALVAIAAAIMVIPALLFILVSVLAWLWKHWKEVWAWIQQAAKDVAEWVSGAVDDIKQAFDDVVKWIEQAGKDIADFFTKDLPKFFEALPEKIGKALESAGKEVLKFIESIPDFVQRLPLILQGLVSTAISWLVDAGIAVITGFWNGMTTAFLAVLSFLILLPGKIIGFLAEAGSWLVSNGFQLIIGFLTGAVDAFFSFIGWVVNDAIPWIITAFADTIVWLFHAGLDLLQGFWDGALAVYRWVIDWIAGFAGNFLTAIGNLIGTLLQKGKDLLYGLWNGALDVFYQVIAWIAGLPGMLIGAIGDLGSKLIEAGQELIAGLWEGIKNGANWLKNKVEGLVSDVVGWVTGGLLGSPWFFTRDVGMDLMKDLAYGLTKAAPLVMDTLKGLDAKLTPELSLAAGRPIAPIGAGVIRPAALPSRTTHVNQENTIYAWDAREAAAALEREKAWAERTAGVA